MDTTYEIKHPWFLYDNDYDDIWDIIFEEEGIVAEENIHNEEDSWDEE